MATIAQIKAAADALDQAATELNKLVAQRAQAQSQLDALAPSITTLRQQVKAAGQNLVSLVNQGIDP